MRNKVLEIYEESTLKLRKPVSERLMKPLRDLGIDTILVGGSEPYLIFMARQGINVFLDDTV